MKGLRFVPGRIAWRCASAACRSPLKKGPPPTHTYTQTHAVAILAQAILAQVAFWPQALFRPFLLFSPRHLVAVSPSMIHACLSFLHDRCRFFLEDLYFNVGPIPRCPQRPDTPPVVVVKACIDLEASLRTAADKQEPAMGGRGLASGSPQPCGVSPRRSPEPTPDLLPSDSPFGSCGWACINLSALD